jgi:hypothetical protein
VEDVRIEPAVQESAYGPPETVEEDGVSGSRCLGWLAAGLYVISFFLPAGEGLLGWEAFFWALLTGIYLPMWTANLVFWLGLGLLASGQRGSAGTAGLVALLLALSESWMVGGGLRVGYWMWAGSMGLLALAGLSPQPESRPRGSPTRSAALPVDEAYRIASRFRR